MTELVREQSVFLVHVCELVRKAGELGFSASAGELYRTPEQQALHVMNGRSTTMASQHLKRLAIDINFFRDAPDGRPLLVSDVETLRPLGQFWEGLDGANRWGGNWTSAKDLPHFERREALDAGVAPASALVATASPVGARGRGLTTGAVGAQCSNARDDVESVQQLLNLCAAAGRVQLPEPLKPDGAFGQKTLDAIMAFQRSAQAQSEPDGRVDANGATLLSLCESLPEAVTPGWLGVLYLRANGEEVAEFSPRLQQVMANRHIDTPLRQAHFLAQIGHESGEFRFRAEIANGEAYQGRADLGNLQPGDGRKFKGRGLIQLTGRANYAEYGRAIGQEAELLDSPERVATDAALCADVAGWYWAKNNLNALADADDLTTLTRRINGGLNGYDDRRRLLLRAKALLAI
ncbi:glycoside hydrolase family 19 protein [Roseateles cellulosilyticus]|uniref:M15 family metallopeptidase n=1 Tax=Pelomonas cellulosilytica TaxID=2906762 RepID=A0ABS8XRQ0_9BURK|nr:glycoside hydrolase family 19 protein [Pelomonas sp. P8]MCE4555399.1 M15 family metallopeptidase [Pelomonas sp. P8]